MRACVFNICFATLVNVRVVTHASVYHRVHHNVRVVTHESVYHCHYHHFMCSGNVDECASGDVFLLAFNIIVIIIFYIVLRG
jgi:hypothetical protein